MHTNPNMDQDNILDTEELQLSHREFRIRYPDECDNRVQKMMKKTQKSAK